jgi:hypothetical protein
MPKTSNPRNQRNNPYLLDDLAVKLHRSAAGVAWRWRSELVLIAAAVAGYLQLAATITTLWALTAIAGILTAALTIPHSRRFLTSRAWCLISRHRLQRVCFEGRLHTRSGRLPLILWIRPTKVGERAHVVCRAGVCADDFDAYRAEIGAACYAREARVIRNKKWSQLVTIDIIRHDPLTAAEFISSHVIGKAAAQQKDTAA